MRHLLWVALVAGCASSPQPEVKAPPTPTVVATSEPLPPAAGTLRRSDVRVVLSDGLGSFLQRVFVDAAFQNGQFIGFRIIELKGPGWNGVDLKPGDVVTSVNGFPVEHPEQAQQAFMSLAVASELRVDYERDGKPRTLRLDIVDQP